MIPNRRMRTICINAVLSAVLFVRLGVARADETMPAFPPQPLANALEALTRQAGLQLIYSSSLSHGIMTHGAPAGLPWQDALRTVLEGTGLTYRLVNGWTVTIVPDPNARDGSGTAQADATQPLPEASASSREAGSGDFRLGDARRPLEQIVITGSHIQGVAPVGGQMITITRKQIDRGGFSTVQDVIRALPQNFAGGPSEDTRSGLDASFNSSRATGLNLRGLGAGSTLVLINGRRLAASGSDGRFVDVSGIPLTAVERVEILPDGASAIYGADAVGGVVNFILRDDYEGAESQIRLGSVTDGPTREGQIAQVFGRRWDAGNALVSLEWYGRDALPSRERRQAASSDLRPLGGDNFDIMEGNPGTILSPFQTWAIPHGQDGTALEESDLLPGATNASNRNEGWDLLPQNKRWSVVGIARHELSDRLELFLDALGSRRETQFQNPSARQTLVVPESNPFYVNPTGIPGPVAVSYSFIDDIGPERNEATVTTANAAFGARWSASDAWNITAYASYSGANETSRATGLIDQVALAQALADPDPATAFNPFGDGSHTPRQTLERIRDDVFGRRNSDLWAFNVTAEGTLLHLSGREVRMALGADFRDQTLDTLLVQGETPLANREFRRDVTAAYAELLVPLVAPDKPLPGIRDAQLSLAARHERYNDFGSATMPKVGLRWSPVEHLAFRGSWARSVKAPSLADLDEGRNFLMLDMQADPAVPGGLSPVLIWGGGNADLQEETADAWTAGLEYQDPSRPWSVSLNYFDIAFADRVDSTEYSTAFLQNPVFADIVTRNPSAALREEICGRGVFVGGSHEDCLALPVAAVIDMRRNNIAVVKTAGVDLLVSHEARTRLGAFGSRVNATYLVDYSQAQFRASPLLSLLDTPGNPLDLRLRGSLSWDAGGLGVTAFVNHTDGYTDSGSIPARRVHSWTTFDLQLRYGASGSDPRRLDGTTLSFNIQNLFDADPPFLNNPEGVGYDPDNADLLGRFASFQIRKAW